MPLERLDNNLLTVFTLLSIKTRIETYNADTSGIASVAFLLYYPLKQGLKPPMAIWQLLSAQRVFTLLSIKTRIETLLIRSTDTTGSVFLLYYPLKQGLKLRIVKLKKGITARFLLYYPLKQGLKRNN